MIDIFFDKLYRYDRIGEPCYIGIPVKEGELTDTERVAVYQKGRQLPVQTRITSCHKDGSVRFLFLRFMADLPANKGTVVQCSLCGENAFAEKKAAPVIRVQKHSKGYLVSTELEKTGQRFTFQTLNGGSRIFECMEVAGRKYVKEQFVGPLLKDGNGLTYEVCMDDWQLVEAGPVCVVLKTTGRNISEKNQVAFELKLTAWAGKPWVEVSYRLINTTDEPLHVASLVFGLLRTKESVLKGQLVTMNSAEKLDSTGCGDLVDRPKFGEGPVYHARGTGELKQVSELALPDNVRTLAGSSNYKTDFYLGRDGAAVSKTVDADYLVKEANEHFAEVFYGTFLADCTDEEGGVCATVFQAQQNYPKAVQAEKGGLLVMLVPEGVGRVEMQTGMSREQKFLLHFHDAKEDLEEIENRSLIYQMPDRPYLSPKTHKDSGVWQDIFPVKTDAEVERCLVGRADGHGRAYGMLNFGDSYDGGYTAQGRGGGELVWCNNEYDYPHACALLYVRTGIRRFLDYNIASCSHWMDVDVCHYHSNPLYIGGQWEHTGGHCKNGVMVCSHEWVEGLLDYYHFTGDERGLETALGIGDNVLRLLETPLYNRVGEINARETGWALRTLTALYVETRDKKWLIKCDRILNDFKVWEEQYGHWLAPYTDNTLVRVGFMISIAVGSVMRYYREFPNPGLKEMMLRAVDDLIENCYMESLDCFYYKELPSLNRMGNNLLILEALAIAYELTGDDAYLKPGIGTFKRALRLGTAGGAGAKKIVKDAVTVGNASSKEFAQSMIPLAAYYKAVCESGLWN